MRKKTIFLILINLGDQDLKTSAGLCFDSFKSLADAKKHCEKLEMIDEVPCNGVLLQSDGTYAGVTGIKTARQTEKQEMFLRLRRIWKIARSLFTENGKLVEVWGEEQDGYYEGCAQVKTIIYRL